MKKIGIKRSHLKEIIRECIEEIFVDEAKDVDSMSNKEKTVRRTGGLALGSAGGAAVGAGAIGADRAFANRQKNKKK